MNFFTGIFQGFWPKISKDIIQKTDSQNTYINITPLTGCLWFFNSKTFDQQQKATQNFGWSSQLLKFLSFTGSFVDYLLLVDCLCGRPNSRVLHLEPNMSLKVLLFLCPYLPIFLFISSVSFSVFFLVVFFAFWANALEPGLLLSSCFVFWKIWASCCL